MLVDVKPASAANNPNALFISLLTTGSLNFGAQRLAPGVYKSSSFSHDYIHGIRDFDNHYPTLTHVEGGRFGSFGVCDNWQQVVGQCKELRASDPQGYVLTITPVTRAEQESRGGWRWHKWGSYIGDQEPCHEYLYDDKHIDLVYTYSVIRVPADRSWIMPEDQNVEGGGEEDGSNSSSSNDEANGW